MLIKNTHILTDQGELRWLRWQDQKIIAMGAGNPPEITDEQIIDADGLILLPGFIDIHIHGGAGHDVMDATPAALQGIAEFCARHGVTSFLPTTLTNTHECIMKALLNIKACMEKSGWRGAAILGAHLEGPYLDVKKCGAQNPQYIRRPQPQEVKEILETGIMRLVDIAPEFPENQWVIGECVQRGITVSVAHSSATAEEVFQAFDLGLSHSTHTYNAQTGLHRREPGIVGAVMAIPQINCELIVDNIHVHPIAVQALWASKKPHGLILITDAVRAAGMPDGEYQFDERNVFLSGGAVRLPNGSLAGSALTMDRALRNFMEATREPLANVWQTSSLNPARAIGMAHRKGSLEIHKDADLVLVDEKINVHLTVVEGEIVYDGLATH